MAHGWGEGEGVRLCDAKARHPRAYLCTTSRSASRRLGRCWLLSSAWKSTLLLGIMSSTSSPQFRPSPENEYTLTQDQTRYVGDKDELKAYLEKKYGRGNDYNCSVSYLTPRLERR